MKSTHKSKTPSSSLSSHPSTRISCAAPNATVVHVAGTFNDWDTTAHPLSRSEGGGWQIDLDLAPGCYEFKFVVDGEWCCESECEGGHSDCPKCVPNPFGTMNRTLTVT